MATVPSICAVGKNGCSEIWIYDKTGVYSSVNQNGWGIPNTPISSVTAAVLNVYKYDSGQLTQLNPSNIDVFSFLPTLSNVPYVLTSSSMNLGGGFPDGIYYITVTYVVGQDELLAEYYFVQDCNVWCCYMNKAKESGCCGDCDEGLEKISSLLLALKHAKDCGDIISVQNILNKLKKLCKDCGCC